MDKSFLSTLADLVLFAHLAIIFFNVFGLIAIPLGAWRGWRFIRVFWWRALHVGLLGVVAVQAVLARVCFLTIWQSDLLRQAGATVSAEPLIQRWINQLIFWPLPLWVFATIYVAVLALTVFLWWVVPPKFPRRSP